eukprot:6192904-Pleurochrysis_carterae.AAC.2
MMSRKVAKHSASRSSRPCILAQLRIEPCPSRLIVTLPPLCAIPHFEPIRSRKLLHPPSHAV